MLILVFILSGILFCYLLLTLAFNWGWLLTPSGKVQSYDNLPFISVVVAARNEENHITHLLKALKHQNYPKNLFEVIVIDDHSLDNTASNTKEFILKYHLQNFHYHENDPAGRGKKHALKQGILKAKGEYVLCTDADCRMSENWMSVMANYFISRKAEMLLGPVILDSGNNTLTRLQSLEFLSLQGSTAGSAYWKQPIMCNGANLGFRKSSYEQIIETIGGKNQVSGDDMFLMEAFQKQYKGKIVFVKELDAVVSTQALPGIRSFLRQRLRWASKSLSYKNVSIIMSGILILLTNMALLSSILFSLLSILPWFYTLVLWLLKSIPDFLLLCQTTSYIKQKRLMLYAPILALLYPFYSLNIGFLSFFVKGKWKGR